MAKETAIPGVSTLGGIFCYAVETGEDGAMPETGWTQIPRCNDISEISLETETIDASAIEDYQSRYIAGRQDTGGSWDVTFNLTDDVITAIETMMSASASALEGGKRTWFQVYFPNLEKGFFIVGQPGSKIPFPAVGQNELLTGSISIAIDEYVGPKEKKEVDAV